MEVKTLKGLALASTAGICWGSMGVAAQYLMAECRFTVLDLTSIRLLGAGILLVLLDIFWNHFKHVKGVLQKENNAVFHIIGRLFGGFYFFNSPVRRTAPVKFPPWARLNNFSIFPKYINSASANREAFTARYAIRQWCANGGIKSAQWNSGKNLPKKRMLKTGVS